MDILTAHVVVGDLTHSTEVRSQLRMRLKALDIVRQASSCVALKRPAATNQGVVTAEDRAISATFLRTRRNGKPFSPPFSGTA